MLIVGIISIILAVLGYWLVRNWLQYDDLLRNASYWVPRDFKRAKSYMTKSTSELCQQYYDISASMYDAVLYSREPLLYSVAVKVLRCKRREDVISVCAGTFKDESVEQFLEQTERIQ